VQYENADKIHINYWFGLDDCPRIFSVFSKDNVTNHYHLMLIGTILWFISAPFWMNKKSHG